MKIEGEPSKRFHVYRTDINDEPYEREGEYYDSNERLILERAPDRSVLRSDRKTRKHWRIKRARGPQRN